MSKQYGMSKQYKLLRSSKYLGLGAAVLEIEGHSTPRTAAPRLNTLMPKKPFRQPTNRKVSAAAKKAVKKNRSDHHKKHMLWMDYKECLSNNVCPFCAGKSRHSEESQGGFNTEKFNYVCDSCELHFHMGQQVIEKYVKPSEPVEKKRWFGGERLSQYFGWEKTNE